MASVYKRGGSKAKGSWYVSWVDHTGKTKTKSARTTDKATAQRIGNKLEADAALRREGVIDARADTIQLFARSPITDSVADFETRLRAAGNTDKHVRHTVGFIRRVIEHAGFDTLGSIDEAGVSRYAADKLVDGASNRTVQAHLTAIKAFTKWLYEVGRLSSDFLASLKKPNPSADRRRQRRFLSPAEWEWLRDYLLRAGCLYGLQADERLLLYRFAIQTGLRANEIRSLTPASLHLEATSPFVLCKAGTTKNRREARQLLDPDLARQLKAYAGRRKLAGEKKLFALPHESNVARMLRDDVEAARAEWLKRPKEESEQPGERDQSDFLSPKNNAGEELDFHSLRHTCGVWLAQTGAHPKTVQQVMRHSSITLTMDTYGHLFPGQEEESAKRLGGLFGSSPRTFEGRADHRQEVQKAHGAQRILQRGESETVRNRTSGRESQAVTPTDHKQDKSRKKAASCDKNRPDAKPCESSGGGTRTPDTRIMIPLL